MALFHSLRNIRCIGTRLYSTCIGVNDVYILSGVRTPIGCFQGSLSSLNGVQLATTALISAVEKSCVNKDEIQEIVLGCSYPNGMGPAPAHQVAIFGGLSPTTVCWTVNKQCGSGMKSIMCACQLITNNVQEVVAVGGVESITHIPYQMKRKNMRWGNICMHDPIFHDGIIDLYDQIDVTQFADDVVQEYGFTREDQDDYSLESFRRAAKAQAEGVFHDEKVPIVVKGKKGEDDKIITDDEEIGRLNVEKFRTLPPTMGKDGTITAGNASGFHDGAAMLILASGNYVLKKNLSPLAKIVSYSDSGIHPRKFIIAPSTAIPKALVRANLTQDMIARWEISETFAAVPMVNSKILRLNPEIVNVHGGAVSLGHPFSMTGSRLIAHLAHTLNTGELGCASMSHAPGGATVIIIEKM